MKINGSDLMAFVESNESYKSIAYATNHVLNVTMNTKDSSTKDNGNGIWQFFEAGLMGWTIQSDNLMSDSAGTGFSMDDLFEMMLKRTPIDVAFALQGNITDYTQKLDQEFVAPAGGWTPDKTNYYHGKALITSLNITGQNGENATASVTFTGCGNLMKVGKGLQKTAPVADTGTPVMPVPSSSSSETKVETASIKK